MADKKVTQMTETTTILGTDLIPVITDPSGSPEAKKMTAANMGVAGAWVTWSPSWTNLTVNNGTVVAKYKQIGKTVFFRITLTFGNTTSVGSAPTCNLPTTPSTEYGNTIHIIGNLIMLRQGDGWYQGNVTLVSSTDIGLKCQIVNGSYSKSLDINTNNPATWGNADVFAIDGVYEAA